MVVLAAAAITAGGVAAYHGGKKAASETARKIKHKMKLSNEEKDRKETFDSRKKERSERFANINQYRQGVSQSVKSKKSTPTFNWGSDKTADDAKARHSTRSTTTSASAHSAKWWEK
jgi:Flp pilus assembly protein TadB